jgi:murein L,D-transpeptidase YafK
MRRLRFVAAAVIVLLLAGLFVLFEVGFYRTTDGARMAMRRINQRIHYGLGYQLPGTPDLARLDERLSEKGFKRGDPIFIRIFKSELTLELWMRKGERFELFASYPICYWSGRLGPKIRTGDRQAPEGFYTVSKEQLNPNSRWFRSFNLGFPNLYDQAHGRTGSYLMVHGGCSSVGCYAMTNNVVAEMWELLTAAIAAGQERFAVHVFPFRLTDARLAAYRDHEWVDFWREMQPGYQLFEVSHIPPQVSVCQGKYAARRGTIAKDGAAPALSQNCPPPDPPAQS